MTARGRLGILGGTFDPIHLGHLDAAAAARAALALDEVWFVPLRDPPHRSDRPRATVFHRFALVALALDEREGCRVSDLEVSRAGPSYTADTLRSLAAAGWMPSQIFLILGSDAFAEIPTWREYPRVLDAAHFAVIARPGTTLDAAVGRTPELGRRIVGAGASLPDPPATAVVLVEAETRDVSSTIVRARIAGQRPVDDLVPAAVARYIGVHHLYEPVGPLHGQEQTHRS
jgi:nicotinate-nucleotide adenylyltransferase